MTPHQLAALQRWDSSIQSGCISALGSGSSPGAREIGEIGHADSIGLTCTNPGCLAGSRRVGSIKLWSGAGKVGGLQK